MGTRWNFRYMWMKLSQAMDVQQAILRKTMQKLSNGEFREVDIAPEMTVRLTSALSRAFIGPLTKVIRFTGPAMAPTLNREGTKNSEAFEFLFVRQLPDPSELTVKAGDVVCLRHPMGVHPSSLLVRRVTACGGDALATEPAQHIAPNSIWVEADNKDLTPPHVEDSRTFGAVPLSNVLGRCIYAFSSKTDQSHIVNNDEWKHSDSWVIEAEVTDSIQNELEDSKSTIQRG